RCGMTAIEHSDSARQKIDPITASVIQGALENIAIEMGYKLMRMSYSSIIRESEDFGAALIDMQNRQLAEAKQSTPLQSGPIPGYIRGLRRLLAERGGTVEPGDVFMHNDPYSGATHGPDVAFVVPAFHRGELPALRSPPRIISISALTPPAAAALSTRSIATPKACVSKPSKSTKRVS